MDEFSNGYRIFPSSVHEDVKREQEKEEALFLKELSQLELEAPLRPSQSRMSSLYEAVVNTLIGFVVAMASTAIIMPMYGIYPSFNMNFQLTAWFTLVSVIRSYFVRRMWETQSWKRLFRK